MTATLRIGTRASAARARAEPARGRRARAAAGSRRRARPARQRRRPDVGAAHPDRWHGRLRRPGPRGRHRRRRRRRRALAQGPADRRRPAGACWPRCPCARTRATSWSPATGSPSASCRPAPGSAPVHRGAPPRSMRSASGSTWSASAATSTPGWQGRVRRVRRRRPRPRRADPAGSRRRGHRDPRPDPDAAGPRPGRARGRGRGRADRAWRSRSGTPSTTSATRQAVTAERALLRALEAGCSAPIGALAEIAEGDDGPEIWIRGVVAAPDGSHLVRLSARREAGPGRPGRPHPRSGFACRGSGRDHARGRFVTARASNKSQPTKSKTVKRTMPKTAAAKTSTRASRARVEQPVAVPRSAGSVAFVGTGPGDPGLLTVRATELIASADVVITEAPEHDCSARSPSWAAASTRSPSSTVATARTVSR